jgi:hypothetical protein
MLKPTEAISKIRELLGLEFAETKQKFYTSSLADGTSITNNTDSEMLELGDTLYVILEDGNLVPAPTGEHTLQSGEVIVLDEESKVVEIKEEIVEEVMPDEVEVVEEQRTVDEEMNEEYDILVLKNEVDSLKQVLSNVLDLIQGLSVETEEQFSKVKKDINTLRKEPEVSNIKNKTKNNKLVVDNFADYRVQQLKKYFN